VPVIPVDANGQSYLEPAVGLLQAYDEFGEAFFCPLLRL
jgi:hypothetical protein